MNSIEALENIAITFDDGGYEPTTLGAKSGHFIEVFGDDFNTIKQELERLKKLEEAIEILKDKIELPLENDFDVVNKDDIHLYRLRTKCLINEKEYEILKEVLGNE